MRKTWKKWWPPVLAMIILLGGMGLAQGAQPVTILLNGQSINTDTPAQIISGRVMVPVRFVSEALGANVSWDDANQRVLIVKPEKQERDLIKLNGELTTWPYWYEDGVLYLEYRDATQFVRECHPHPSYVVTYYRNENVITLNSQRVELYTKKEDGYTLVSLDQLKRADLVNYDWDEQNANLTIREMGK